ncbi:hypothetical protein HD806DRAFT_76727 [Xylariaceae sp. AK1471]|nr:hypothetical protein HD806DRAFT_76727 [Xylariaceae sp. AK1471]
MKSIVIVFGLFAAGAFGAPVSTRGSTAINEDAFNYHDNINNAVTVPVDNEEFDPLDDSFNYHDNINNAVTVPVDGKEVDSPEGTKIVLSSPYTDDVEKADRHKVLGE